jgi:electron transfer flavoprotein beta subunit
MGKQAIDDDSNQCGQMLSALLGLAAGHTYFERHDQRRQAPTSRREIDGGLEKTHVKLPAVVTAGSAPQ